jgi:hypothetical protein
LGDRKKWFVATSSKIFLKTPIATLVTRKRSVMVAEWSAVAESLRNIDLYYIRRMVVDELERTVGKLLHQSTIPGFSLEVLRKMLENLSQDSRLPGRDSSQTSGIQLWILTATPASSVGGGGVAE